MFAIEVTSGFTRVSGRVDQMWNSVLLVNNVLFLECFLHRQIRKAKKLFDVSLTAVWGTVKTV